MSYPELVEFARTYGLIYWIILTFTVVIFTFRRRAKKGFEHAARIHLNEPELMVGAKFNRRNPGVHHHGD